MSIRPWAMLVASSMAVCGIVALAGPVRVPTPGMHAQKKDKPKRTEAEDDVPKAADPEVTRIDDPDVKPSTTKAKSTGDLTQAARDARHPRAKELFADLAVAHDEVVVRGLQGVTVDGVKSPDRTLRVAPFVDHLDDTAESKVGLELQIIDEAGKPIGTKKVGRKSILSVRYHEQIAVEEVTKFLDEPFGKKEPRDALYLGRLDQIQVGETALTGVLQMHQSAREREARRGPSWDKVETALRDTLLKVKLMQLDLLVEAKSWDAGFDLVQQLVTTFKLPGEHAKIAPLLGELLKKAFKDPSYTQDRLHEVRRRLRQVEDEFPGSKLVDPINASLRDQAQELFDRAKALIKEKKLSEATELLKQAEETWPDLPGLSDKRLEVMGAFQVLKVGMRELPVYMSPGWAHTDAELRAVELLFEGLVGLTPDEHGAFYYRPVLARRQPRVIALGRQFELPRQAKWSDGRLVTVSDLTFTHNLMKVQRTESGPAWSERGPAWGELLEKVQVEGDPSRMKIRLRQGMLDPLSAMSFKVLPRGARPAEKAFAEKPIGSGPFYFEPLKDRKERLSEFSSGPPYARFLANPHYGKRANRSGLPYIRELRIYAPADPVKEMKDNRLDMVVDLSAEQAAALAAVPGIEVKMPTPKTSNRRVYFLAVNHRRPALVNADLRIALARAIHRDQLLDDHFRKGLGKKVHRSINGVYPAGSWACSPHLAAKGEDPTLDPYDKVLAKTKFREAKTKLQGEVALTLKYPSGDSILAAAMTALCEQVEKTLVGVKLTPVAKTPYELREAVEQTFDYDLAYYSYDFPDESYWLQPLFGPNGRGGGDNYLGYNGPLVGKIHSATTLRHFSQVREYAHAIHRQLESEMPLIPLWQLDPLMAVRAGRVEMPTIDPQALFTRVEEWRVRGR